jgi:D-alanyl-D-alanine carboxypeptidase (penicillin-binding protein 5/6)
MYIPVAKNPSASELATAKTQIGQEVVSFSKLQILFDEFFPEKNILAKGVYVVAWDTKTHRFHDFYAKNPDVPYNSASIAKLVTALTLSKFAEMSQYLDATGNGFEGSTLDFPDQSFKKQDLIAAMLIQSSNQASYTLAKPFGLEKFIEMMNTEAGKIGLKHSILRDPSGLDERNRRGASYMSPRDVARASFELVSRFPDITKLSSRYTYTINDQVGGKFTLKNTNPLVSTADNVLLSKTGFTNLAGGNLVMVTEPSPGVWVASVVMKSTKETRTKDMEVVLDALNTTFDVYKRMGEVK